jgi:dipeptidyl aminopeptidase/acylaminoacyl peptidase
MHKMGILGFVLATAVSFPAAPAAPARHPLELADLERMAEVESPACSPDGNWIAYTVTTIDREDDEKKTAVWMVDWAGREHVQATEPLSSASEPAFSPDGRYLSFLGSRGADEHDHFYVIDRRGGEARRLTPVDGNILEYRWSPDARQVALVVAGTLAAADASRPGAAVVPKPIVLDRVAFKTDHGGYRAAGELPRIYLLDVASGVVRPLSAEGRYAEQHPAWSPDSTQLAYVSNHDAEPDLSGAADLYVSDLRTGNVRSLTRFYLPNAESLQWTADGRRIAYTIGLEPRLSAYIHDRLALIDASGGSPVIVTDALDRGVSHPVPGTAADRMSVLLEDDGSTYPASIDLRDGKARRLVAGPLSATAQCGAAGHVAVLASADTAAKEIHALDNGRLRALTHHNDALMAELELGAVEDIAFKSADGAEIHGMIVKPPGFVAGRRYPTVLWIHGGPQGQDEHGLAFDAYSPELKRQWFAAHGYVSIAVNYRGGSGRGAAFQRAILGDWGHLEVVDLLAAVDHVVALGVADPGRLGIGGWSYGGILTDYAIASDGRFKAAVSGAGSGNQLSMFGSDQYVMQYLQELGAPWKDPQPWIRVSYPFFHADRIHTPTLFVGGEKDFNVPIAGGEQMYQALRVQGVPTQLVVYPGQHHVFERPSYIRDLMERSLAWYDRYLK